MKNFIKLENQWFYNGNNTETILHKKYDKIGFAVSIILKKTLTVRDYYLLDYNYILQELKVHKTDNRVRQQIKQVIEQMNQDGYINLYTDSQLTDKVEDMDFTRIYYCTIEEVDNNFFILHDTEIDCIISTFAGNKEISTYSILSYFGLLSSMFGAKETEDNYKICYPSFEYVSKTINIAESIITKYNQKLKELKLITYCNTLVNTKTGRNESITYTRYEDKKYLDASVSKYLKNSNVAVLKKETSELVNQQKSIKQKINNFKKGKQIDTLSSQEFEDLQKLELEYFRLNLQRGKDKLKKGSNLWTIRLDGTRKDMYQQQPTLPWL